MSQSWYEVLPEKCPPQNATEPNSVIFYRLCSNNPPQNDDFLSHKFLFPAKVFNTTECICRALSLWTNKEICLTLTKLPLHKKKCVAEVTLNNCDGLILKTGKEFHYSWWRTKEFDIKKCLVV